LAKATVPGVGLRPLTGLLPVGALPEELLDEPPEELLDELLPEELLEEAPEELPEELRFGAGAPLPEPPPQAASSEEHASSVKAAAQGKFTPDMIDPVELVENPEQRRPRNGVQGEPAQAISGPAIIKEHYRFPIALSPLRSCGAANRRFQQSIGT
jgi:hypothetical protein